MRFSRELIYSIMIFLSLIVYRTVFPHILALVLMLLGMSVLAIWLYFTLNIYSNNEVTEYKVAIKYRTRTHLASFVFVPMVLLLSAFAFVSIVWNGLVNDLVVTITSVLLLLLMINIKSSMYRIYTVENATRSVFQIVNVFLFFILSIVAYSLMNFEFKDMNLQFIAIYLISTILLTVIPILDHKHSFTTIIVSLILSSPVSFIYLMLFNRGSSFLIIGFLTTVSYYVVSSILWMANEGERETSKFLEPIMFGLISLILFI